MPVDQQIIDLLQKHPNIEIGILFGSVSEGREDAASDLDLAVACTSPLDAADKMQIIEELAVISSRPVDLIDLQQTSGTLLHQILTKGKLLYCKNHLLYAQLIKRMLFNQADMMPYYYRILEERRNTWINKS